jgi:hypothetical protein
MRQHEDHEECVRLAASIPIGKENRIATLVFKQCVGAHSPRFLSLVRVTKTLCVESPPNLSHGGQPRLGPAL